MKCRHHSQSDICLCRGQFGREGHATTWRLDRAGLVRGSPHRPANHEAIAAAKAGVIGLTLSAAATYASKGIRVNAVAPGLVRTAMTERIWGNVKSAEASQSMHALGRLGEPADVASCITWLLDPANAWITGQVVGVAEITRIGVEQVWQFIERDATVYFLASGPPTSRL